MQELEKQLVRIRRASPIDRICAQIAHDGDAITFRALTVCEHCGRDIALGAVFSWSEWGWYRGDYNRAQGYADATTYAHDAQEVCKKNSC